MASELLTSFSGAIQASLSVLLVIFYGVIASQYGLLTKDSARHVSQVSVKLFLPFLLIVKVGKEFNIDNATNYIPIVVWALFYTLVSLGIGQLGVKFLHLPVWVTPAVAFNNTTSLPLLLVQSFESTGLLDTILRGDENTKDAISRAQSYFLVCSVISNCLTFGLGPVLLDGEERDERDYTEQRKTPPRAPRANGQVGPRLDTIEGMRESREHDEAEARERGETNETTSLLPDAVNDIETQISNVAHDHSHAFLHRHHSHFDDFSARTNKVLGVIAGCLNGVLVGAIIGVVIGLVPALHKAFFNESKDGGIFTAWLTQSLQNTGNLFVTLQVILVGVKLSSSLRRMKRGESESSSGKLPWSAAAFVFFVRYIFWPLVGIPIIYGLAKMRTKGGDSWLDDDPILWFAMMLMATGPPAMSLVPMADVSGTDEAVKMSVAKLLTLMYGVSPLLALVVVWALKASQSLSER